MATFHHLPVELLLRIATYLDEDPDRKETLRHLALLSREARPVAQEVLHRTLAVDNHPRIDWGLTRLERSLRTLLTKPELARRVQDLSISLEYPDYWMQGGMPWEYARKSGDIEIDEPCAQFIEGMDMRLWLKGLLPSSDSQREVRYREYRNWLRQIRKETGGCAPLLLQLVPNLESLSLHAAQPWDIDVHRWLPIPHLLSPVLVAGFQKLTSLTLNFLPPWSLLGIPTLNRFHFDTNALEACAKDMDQDELFLPWAIMGRPYGAMNTNLVSLVVTMDMAVFERLADSLGRLLYCESVARLQEHLKALRSFRIRLQYTQESQHMDGYETEVTLYNELMPFIRNTGLETFIMDAKDVDWERYAREGFKEEPHDLWTAESAEPLDLGELPNRLLDLGCLRRIVAPQEAYFFHYRPDSRYDALPGHSFAPLALPPSVESIEVIDSTRSLNRWAKYVLDHRDKYPNLKRVVLWCDRHSSALVHDKRLRPVGEPDIHILDHRGTQTVEAEDTRMMDDVDDKVWEDLQEAGISLVINTERRGGWRDHV
jgi:hypothetical protein